MSVLKKSASAFLIVLELYLAYSHINVLFGIKSIEGLPLELQKGYFTTDMLSVVVSLYLLGRPNIMLSVIHFVIHSSACMHLCEIYPTHFYKEVFRLAELKTSTPIITNVYVVFTVLDILCHFVNVSLHCAVLASKSTPSSNTKCETAVAGSGSAVKQGWKQN